MRNYIIFIEQQEIKFYKFLIAQMGVKKLETPEEKEARLAKNRETLEQGSARNEQNII
jgi:hypothetical protein